MNGNKKSISFFFLDLIQINKENTYFGEKLTNLNR